MAAALVPRLSRGSRPVFMATAFRRAFFTGRIQRCRVSAAGRPAWCSPGSASASGRGGDGGTRTHTPFGDLGVQSRCLTLRPHLQVAGLSRLSARLFRAVKQRREFELSPWSRPRDLNPVRSRIPPFSSPLWESCRLKGQLRGHSNQAVRLLPGYAQPELHRRRASSSRSPFYRPGLIHNRRPVSCRTGGMPLVDCPTAQKLFSIAQPTPPGPASTGRW